MSRFVERLAARARGDAPAPLLRPRRDPLFVPAGAPPEQTEPLLSAHAAKDGISPTPAGSGAPAAATRPDSAPAPARSDDQAAGQSGAASTRPHAATPAAAGRGSFAAAAVRDVTSARKPSEGNRRADAARMPRGIPVPAPRPSPQEDSGPRPRLAVEAAMEGHAVTSVAARVPVAETTPPTPRRARLEARRAEPALPGTRPSRVEVRIGRVEVRRPRPADPPPRSAPTRPPPSGPSRGLADLAAARRYVDRGGER